MYSTPVEHGLQVSYPDVYKYEVKRKKVRNKNIDTRRKQSIHIGYNVYSGSRIVTRNVRINEETYPWCRPMLNEHSTDFAC